MRAGVVVDVYCYAAEGGDFGGELGEAGVVLSVGWKRGLDMIGVREGRAGWGRKGEVLFAVVGVGHGG